MVYLLTAVESAPRWAVLCHVLMIFIWFTLADLKVFFQLIMFKDPVWSGRRTNQRRTKSGQLFVDFLFQSQTVEGLLIFIVNIYSPHWYGCLNKP